MTNDPEKSFSDLDALKNRLRAIDPMPTTASLERVFERIEPPPSCKPALSSPQAVWHCPTWAIFSSGVGFGAIAATIAWIAMTGWMASATRDSKLASETSVLQTPSKSVAASPVAPTMKIKNTVSKTDSKTVSKTNGTSASSLHSVGNDEFGLDMIRDTLSVISKQQWDRRRLEERGFSISTQFYRSSDRSKVPYTSPSTRTTTRPHNSVWEIGRGDLDGIEL